MLYDDLPSLSYPLSLRRLRVASQFCRPISKFVCPRAFPQVLPVIFYETPTKITITRTAHDMNFEVAQTLTQRRQVSVGGVTVSLGLATGQYISPLRTEQAVNMSTLAWRVGNEAHSAGIKR
jgi:hypothetical protein